MQMNGSSVKKEHHGVQQFQERRVSADGDAYTLQEFVDFFGEADGHAQWSAAAPQTQPHALPHHEEAQAQAVVESNESPTKQAVHAALSQAQVVLNSCSQQAFDATFDQSCAALLRASSSQSLRKDLPSPPVAVPSKSGSARVVVPKLQLPKPEAEPFEPLVRPPLISSIGSDDGACTPCHSLDRPLFGQAPGLTPHETADNLWLGRPSEESCISRVSDRTSPSEGLTRCPSSATSSVGMQESEREMLHKFEDENMKLREALNVEKQRVLDLKLADQNRRSQWKRELQQIEADLVDKRSLEVRCAQLAAEVDRLRIQGGPTAPRADPVSTATPTNSAQLRLHQVVSLFIMHVREPLSAVRDACAELSAEDSCPECPAAVEAGAADGEHVDRLMRVLEVLRRYEEVRRAAKACLAGTTSEQLGAPDRTSGGRSFGPTPPEQDRLSLSVTGVAAAGGRKVLQTLDETVDDISDWLLGQYQRGHRGDGGDDLTPRS